MTPPRAWSWLCDEPHQQVGVRVASAAIAAALLFRVFTETPFAPFLWGPHGIAAGQPLGASTPTGNAVQDVFGTMTGTYLTLALLAVSSTSLLFGYQTRIAIAVAYVAFYLLGHRNPLLEDGGDNISRLVLGYLLFALPNGKSAPKGSARVFVHNVAVVAVAVQVMILYETSGLFKAFGDRWHHGTAMYYISQVEWFSHPAFRSLLQQPAVTTLASYATIFYQVTFPMAMFSRLKITWLAMGFALHLGILVTMGLVTFSTVMMGLELFMITDAEWAVIAERTRHAITTLERWSAPLSASLLDRWRPATARRGD